MLENRFDELGKIDAISQWVSSDIQYNAKNIFKVLFVLPACTFSIPIILILGIEKIIRILHADKLLNQFILAIYCIKQNEII